jgi:uncharacterized membrane protein
MPLPRLDLTVPHHPAVIDQFNKRAESAQLRVADQITRFAGSMAFVYLHIALFATWMLVIERSPWPTLTLIASLDAIFLSTFVMIGRTDRLRSNKRRPTTISSLRRPSSRRTPN